MPNQRKDDYLTLSIKLIGFGWFSEVCLWQFSLKANIGFHVLEQSHDPTYPCSIVVLLQLIYCNTPIPEEWETDYSVWTTAVCWDLGGSYKVTSIWVSVSSTWSSDLVSLSNGIEDIEGGKSRAKVPIKSHYRPVWWAQGSAGHLMTTTGTVSAAHKTRRPVRCRGALLMAGWGTACCTPITEKPTWPWAQTRVHLAIIKEDQQCGTLI